MYSWISALTRRLPPAVKKLSDNKSCHRVNGGEVQKRAYANRAFLIACVRVHYADERGIKTKNKQEICTSYASRVPRHASHSWNQREHKLIICRALGGKHRMRLKAGTQAPRLFLPELNTNLTIKKKTGNQSATSCTVYASKIWSVCHLGTVIIWLILPVRPHMWDLKPWKSP